MGLVSQNKVVDDLQFYLSRFHEVIHLSWDEWVSIPLRSRQKLCNRSRASCIHNFMIDHASRLLPDAHIVDLAKLKIFSIGDYAIRFKKLDEVLKSRNQHSEQVQKFKGQQQLEGLATAHNLEVGYQLDPFEQSIQSCHLVCPNGNKIYWGIEILDTEIQRYGGFDLFTGSDDQEDTAPAQFKEKKKGEVVPFGKVGSNDNGRNDKQ